MRALRVFKIVSLLFVSLEATAKLKVVTTTTDINWIVHQVGGDRVESEALLSPDADPHYVDAMPHFIHKVASADMVCFVGLDLEVGWLPKVLSRSGNSQVQKGGKGYCETGRAVKALDVIQGKVDRSMGDVHAGGNPHFQLGPSYLLQASGLVFERLVSLDPAGQSYFSGRLHTLESRLKELQVKISWQLKTFLDDNPSFKVIEYHKEFTYFLTEFGIPSHGTIEEKPGVAPSAGRLARIAVEARRGNVQVALAANHSPKRLLAKFTEISSVPHRALPLSVRGPASSFASYSKLIENVASAITKN